MQFGRRQVNASTVHVGLGIGEAIRLRPDHAPVDDARVQVLWSDVVAFADFALFELGQHCHLAAFERVSKPSGKRIR